jgi:hypothetical protein
MNSLFKTLVCSLALLASGHSFALYRCGNVFQDQPCDITDAQAAVATSARAAAKPPADSSASVPAGTVSPFAMACARVGKSSLDIIWKREAGALREAQYANAEGNPDHKNLVDSVYEQRGTAPLTVAAAPAGKAGDSAAPCANLSSQLAPVQDRARRGGGLAAMEQLANERLAIDSKISAAKC